MEWLQASHFALAKTPHPWEIPDRRWSLRLEELSEKYAPRENGVKRGNLRNLCRREGTYFPPIRSPAWAEVSSGKS